MKIKRDGMRLFRHAPENPANMTRKPHSQKEASKISASEPSKKPSVKKRTVSGTGSGGRDLSVNRQVSGTRSGSVRPGSGSKDRLLSEDSLIKMLAAKFTHPHPELLKGIGDDTSVTANTPGTVLLATTDTLVESTHFTLKNTTPEALGSKALNVSVSDIAAMGARPTFFLVSLVLPPGIGTDFVTLLYRGINAAARAAGATMVGGNMASGSILTITTTLFGETAPERVVYRSGATDGDDLYVTGTPGDSALGLKILGSRGSRQGTKKELLYRYRAAVKKHLMPAPRLKAGMRLASEGIAASMIDISDGLVLDVTRLAKESGMGITINLPNLPLSSGMRKYMAVNSGYREKGVRMALSGGEDYELLFTTDKGNRQRIQEIATELKLKITRIGTVTPKKSGVRLLDNSGKEMELKQTGYTHF